MDKCNLVALVVAKVLVMEDEMPFREPMPVEM